MVIQMYSPMRKAHANRDFVNTFIDVDEDTSEEFMESKNYKCGDEFEVLALVRSKACFSGFAYVVCDKEIEDVYVVDKSLISLYEI